MEAEQNDSKANSCIESAVVAVNMLAKALGDSFLQKQRIVWQDKDICLAIV